MVEQLLATYNLEVSDEPVVEVYGTETDREVVWRIDLGSSSELYDLVSSGLQIVEIPVDYPLEQIPSLRVVGWWMERETQTLPFAYRDPYSTFPENLLIGRTLALSAQERFGGIRLVGDVRAPWRPADDQARLAISKSNLQELVTEMAEIVDRESGNFRRISGAVRYEESKEDPDDWEIVVETKLEISHRDEFALSLQIGEDLNKVLAGSNRKSDWMRISYSLRSA